MNPLKHLWRSIVQLVDQAGAPQATGDLVRQQQRQTVLNAQDERLDRLRNPSRYLGK